jgi:MoxR-like ATPase
LDYPSEDKEIRIVLARVPGIEARLAGQVVRFVQAVRKEDLRKTPGVAETLDFAAALMGLGAPDLSVASEAVLDSLLCLLKTHEDQQALSPEVVARMLGKVA